MREIKFRAWNKTNKQMLYNVEKTYDYGCRGDNEVLEESFKEVLADTETYQVMEYTGLKDKNGKEIYEGDIVYVEQEENYEVKYDNGTAMYVLESYDLCINFDNVYSKELEVIGNIYEVPELIEE